MLHVLKQSSFILHLKLEGCPFNLKDITRIVQTYKAGGFNSKNLFIRAKITLPFDPSPC